MLSKLRMCAVLIALANIFLFIGYGQSLCMAKPVVQKPAAPTAVSGANAVANPSAASNPNAVNQATVVTAPETVAEKVAADVSGFHLSLIHI